MAAMGSAEVPAGDKGRLVELVAGYCGVQVGVKISSVSVPTLKTDAGERLTGMNVVCQYLVEVSGRSSVMLGSDPVEQAQVSEWLSWANTELTPLVDEKLLKINEWLQTRTYIIGNRLTLADLVVFGTVYPAAASFPVAQHMHFCNLLRWCDLLQHTAGLGIYPELNFERPRFKPPQVAVAASVAPAKAAAAAAAPPSKVADSNAASKASADGAAAKKGKEQPAAAAAATTPAAAAPAAAATTSDAAAAAPVAGDAKKKKEEKKEGKGTAPAAAAKEDDSVGIDNLDMRVGVIVKVDKHPNADSLYLEEIDVGEAQPRQVVSGLVKYVPLEQMQNRRVIVVCNLKPGKLREVMSYGMVLCASDNPGGESTVVEPIAPPPGVPAGERIKVEGYDREPLAEINNAKKKTLDKLFPDMMTNADGIPCYKGVPFMTSQGAVTSSVPGGMVK